MKRQMRGHSWLIVQIAIILAALGFLSFWRVPAYEQGAALIVAVFADALKVLLGYKFGRSMPQQTNSDKGE